MTHTPENEQIRFGVPSAEDVPEIKKDTPPEVKSTKESSQGTGEWLGLDEREIRAEMEKLRLEKMMKEARDASTYSESTETPKEE